MNDEKIYEDMQTELRDKLIVYMMDTDNPKAKKYLEILGGPRADFLEIGLQNYAIGIRKGFKDDSASFQWIYLNNEEYPIRIYEYNPADGALSLFE